MENDKEIIWNVCPNNWKKNFKCSLVQGGNWKEEGKGTRNKWLFKIETLNGNPIPTFADQRNFFTGLFEAEWKNDNYVFCNNNSRPPQREKKIEMFKQMLEEIGNRPSVKDTKRGLAYYFNLRENDK